jgi:hypothetical protein
MPNPYNYESPLDGRATFYGRSSELTRIASRIAAERPQSVSVVGPTQTGKSSLVNYFFDPDVQADYLEGQTTHVLLRLRLSMDTPATPAEFFERVSQSLKFAGVEMVPSQDGFSDVVRQLMSEERRMIVFLDDFGEVTRNAGFTLDFFSFLRSIANGSDVAYLTTSSRPLNTLCHTQDIEESPFFNIFTTVNLDPFSEADARRLVTEPAAAAGSPFGDEIEPILELSGRHPYLLQVAASVAFDSRAAGQVFSVSAQSERVYEISRGYLNRVWEELSEPQRQVLAAVSAAKPVERRHQYAVESLERLGLLQTDGGDPEFAAGLVRRHAQGGDSGGKKSFLKRLFG